MSLPKTDRRSSAHRRQTRTYREKLEANLTRLDAAIAEGEKMEAALAAARVEREKTALELRLLGPPGG